jgi:hypothetical protein
MTPLRPVHDSGHSYSGHYFGGRYDKSFLLTGPACRPHGRATLQQRRLRILRGGEMAKGILYTETYALPGQLEAYHRWYDEVHLKEFLASVEGVVLARRFTPRNPDDPFITIYEIDADDLDAVVERMASYGKTQMSEAVGVDGSRKTSTRFYELRTTYPSDA